MGTVGTINTWVARTHVKTRREQAKQTQNNEVRPSKLNHLFIIPIHLIFLVQYTYFLKLWLLASVIMHVDTGERYPEWSLLSLRSNVDLKY